MGIFDWLFGKKKIDEKSEIIQNVKPKKTSSNTSKKEEKSKKKNTSNSLNQFTKQEQSDLRVYAFLRCLAEMMKADGAVDPGEVQFMVQFSEEEQKKLSKPYNVGSKLGKFIWGNPYESVSTNRKNLISVIKTNTKRELDNFFEKIIVMAVADRDLDNRESQYLIGLCADIFDVSIAEAKDIAGSHLKRLGLIK